MHWIFATTAAAVDRSANGSTQQHDPGSHEAASRGRDSIGRSTWFGSGFCATNHRGGEFGRFCMKECDLSSKARKSVPEKRRNVPSCWGEHFTSLAMR